MKQFFKKVLASAIGMFLGLLAALIFIPLVIAIFVKGMQGRIEPIEDKSVLLLDLHGRLVEKARPLDFDFFSRSPFSDDERGTGLYELTKAIDIAKKDKRIKGLYLQIGHIEAGWATTEALRRAILDFRTSEKFVYAYSESYDERTYYLATAADKIFMQPNGDIEFNGLEMISPFLKGLFVKLDVQPRIFRVGKFKAAVEPLILDKMSDENREQSKTLVDDLWTVVKTEIAGPRKLSPEAIDLLAEGLKISSAEEALAAKLVDQLAFEDEVKDLISQDTVGIDEDPEFVTPGQLLHNLGIETTTGKNKIAVVFAEGEIVGGSGDLDSIGSREFVETLDEARQDEDVKAIVLRVNSPGGDALASDVIWRELAITDKEIPVVSSMGDVAASGGYYIAAAGREIFAENATITGSIGVFGIMFGMEDFWAKKFAINFDRVVTHPYSDIGSSTRPMTEAEQARIQSDVERVYTRFVSVVRDSRKLDKDLDPGMFAEGRVWSGTRAKTLKLVDHIGGLQDAIKRAAELAELGDDYELETYPKPEEPFQMLFELVSGETARSIFSREGLLREVRNAVGGFPFTSGVYARLPFDLHVH